MKMPLQNKPRRQGRRRSDEIAFIRHSVTRACGLRPDLDRLDDDELNELRALVQEIRSGAEPGIGRSSPGYLEAKERRRWELLVEKACASPGHFARERTREAAEKAAAERARTPSPHPRYESPGTIVLPDIVFDWIQNGDMQASHLLVLMLVLAMIENKAPVHRYAGVEDDAVIVPTVEHLVAAIDPYQDIRRVGLAVEELVDANLLLLKRLDGAVRLSLGPTLVDALERRAAA
jgi:hypothetical protein